MTQRAGAYDIFPLKESTIPPHGRADFILLHNKEVVGGIECEAVMLIFDKDNRELDRVPCELRKVK